MDLPLQGIPSSGSKSNSAAIAEPGRHSSWSIPNEFPLQDLSKQGKQTRRGKIEEGLSSNLRSTKEIYEGQLGDDLDFGV